MKSSGTNSSTNSTSCDPEPHSPAASQVSMTLYDERGTTT